jgi:membrane-bound serine protease (ClpP class)
MEFLLDPNVAYIILLAGVILLMMAIVTPGTGIFEVGALFCLALVGYALYNLSFNWWALLILAFSIVPFVYSIQKPKRELFLGLFIILLVIGSIFIFPSDSGVPAVNPFVAVISSALVAGFIWTAVHFSMKALFSRPSNDLEELVGQTGEAKTKVEEEGSVQVAGELWSARSEQPIDAGSPIRVVRREGFTLVVEKNI